MNGAGPERHGIQVYRENLLHEPAVVLLERHLIRQTHVLSDALGQASGAEVGHQELEYCDHKLDASVDRKPDGESEF